VFKLRLPRCSPLGGAAAVGGDNTGSTTAAWSLTGLSVLVVDDEETVRTSTAAALRLYGFRVEVADGLAQAIATAERLGSKLDALITDFRLRNGEDGIKVAAVLRQLLGDRLPVLLVTGDTAPERVRQAQQSGLRVLYKPVKVARMVDELAAQLGVSRAADPTP
jgi:CheY-like chemotaxis protein